MKKQAALKNPEVDTYIAGFPRNVQTQLQTLRKTILAAAPEAEECISYMMPAYKKDGPLVYFGGFKNHIGFFPTPSAVEAFKNELTGYTLSKGTIQFPLDNSLPLQLITRIVQFRLAENEQKAERKRKKSK